MANILAQFWDWLTNRRPANFEEWSDRVQKELKSKASASVYSTIPTAPDTGLPLGSRFRTPPSDYEMTMGQVEELNRLVKTIRPLPQGAIKVMQALDSADASAASVAHAVECEPVTAASVVRLANSTAMGLRREITSVSDAVAYLGFSTTKTILLRFNMDALLPSSRPGKGYDSAKLWVHAMAVAQVSEELARRAGRTDPSLALMAGLLHDIGKLAINSKYPDALDQLWSPDADPNEGLLNRERRLFQADHAIIGGTLASEWKLPHDLLEIVRLHHTPFGQPIDLQPEAQRVLFCVQVANQLVKFRHVYCDGMEIDEVPAEMTSELGLPDWSQLLADAPLRSMIDRIILLNGGTTVPAAVAA
jgi:putative nucleotidyltransferase with HDIG domain